jgi:hypothetical protein
LGNEILLRIEAKNKRIPLAVAKSPNRSPGHMAEIPLADCWRMTDKPETVFCSCRCWVFGQTSPVRAESRGFAIEDSEMQRAEVNLECARWHWKQTNPLAPEDLGDEHFFTPPANSAILADWAHDVAIVVRDVVN